MKKIFLANKIKLKNGNFFIKRIFNIKQSHCARYTRLQAKNLFNLEFPANNAWDLIYFTEIVENLNSLEDLKNSKKLKPGNVILCYNPLSNFNGKKDIKGNEIKFTHTLLYLGEDFNEEKIFIHQYINEQVIINLEEISGYKLIPKYILKPKNN
jgi:hypothetical protein